jgi:hypothetical protein
MSYRESDRYYNTYDQQSDFQRYLRDRQRVNMAMFGIDNSGIEIPKVRPDHLHIPLKLMADKKTGKDALFCRECGVFWPLDFDKSKPKPKPKESKVKQKETKQSKTFIKPVGPAYKKKGGFIGANDTTSELSDEEVDYVSRIYGNVTDFSEGLVKLRWLKLSKKGVRLPLLRSTCCVVLMIIFVAAGSKNSASASRGWQITTGCRKNCSSGSLWGESSVVGLAFEIRVAARCYYTRYARPIGPRTGSALKMCCLRIDFWRSYRCDCSSDHSCGYDHYDEFCV